MADAFSGLLKDTHVTAPVDSIRCLSATVGVGHTVGGIFHQNTRIGTSR